MCVCHLCHSTTAPPFTSPAAGRGERGSRSVLGGHVSLGVNQEQREGSVPAPPCALRKVLGVFWAPLSSE